MRTVLLLMNRTSNTQGIMRTLSVDPELRFACETDYARADAKAHGADVALIEVAESGGYDVAFCLALCDRIRRTRPECRLLLMCPERDRICVDRAVGAKQAGRIDDFVFYDASVDYLASKLSSM